MVEIVLGYRDGTEDVPGSRAERIGESKVERELRVDLRRAVVDEDLVSLLDATGGALFGAEEQRRTRAGAAEY